MRYNGAILSFVVLGRGFFKVRDGLNPMFSVTEFHMFSIRTEFSSRIAVLFSALLLLLSSPLQANQSPDAVLSTVSTTMFDRLEQDLPQIQKEPQLLFDLVEEVLVPYVDMPRMSQLVLAKYWRTASEAQRDRFIKEFKTLLVRFYVSALLDDVDKLDMYLENRNNLVEYQPASVKEGDRLTQVRATVTLPENGQQIPVLFTLFSDAGEWKVVDVKVEGISLVTNYRTSFSTEIRRDGLDAVIDRLADRNKELLVKAVEEPTPADSQGK